MGASATPVYSPAAQTGAQWLALSSPVAMLLGSDFFYRLNTGSLSPDEVNQIKAQNAAAIVQAATDPNTGAVNTDLVNSQIAQMNAEIDSVIAQSQASSTGNLAADLYDKLIGTGPTWSNLLGNVVGPGSADTSGLSFTKLLSVLADVLIIGGVAVGAYFLVQAVRQ